jgi:hypothetical protein
LCKPNINSTKNNKNCPDAFIRAIKEFAHDFGYVITSSKNIKTENNSRINKLLIIKNKLSFNFKKKRRTITIKLRLVRIDKAKDNSCTGN